MTAQEQIKRALEVSNLDYFSFREYQIGGDDVILCCPRPNPPKDCWNKENLILRSLIYRKSDYFPISLSFKKFGNEGENPEVFGSLEGLDINKLKFSQKMDGSLIAISKPFSGPILVRTRGSHGIDQHETGPEIWRLVKDYNIEFIFNQFPNLTLIFEHTTCSRTIVVKYDKPELTLIGAIRHLDYQLCSQDWLDRLALTYNLKRPRYYQFNSYQEALNSIAKFDSEEGCCAYFNNDQSIIKVKGEWYCRLHSLKASFGSWDKLITEFFISGATDFISFYKYISETFDFEIAQFLIEKINIIADVYIKINIIVKELLVFCNETEYNSQKHFAQCVQAKYEKELQPILFELRAKGSLGVKIQRAWIEREISNITRPQETQKAADEEN